MRSGIDLPAPPLEIPQGGGGSGWVRLTRADDDIDAHLLTGRLSEAGIESYLVKDRGAPGAWLYGGSNPWAPVTILVKRSDYEAARLVLAEIAFDAPPVDPQRPPGQPLRPTGGPILWWGIAIALGVLFTIASVISSR